MAATAWGTCNTEYYDWDEKVWKFGPSEENFKDMLAYYKKLYEEELILWTGILLQLSSGHK